MRLTFTASIALNLLLLTTLVAARVDPDRAGSGSHNAYAPVPSVGGPADEPVGVRTASELVRVLSRTQLGSAEIRALTLAWLERRDVAAQTGARAPYWRQGFSPLLDELEATAAAAAFARNELLAVFGREAAADPAFERVFRPLGAGYAFLGTEAQIALQQHQIERLQTAAATPGAAPLPGGCMVRDAAGSAAAGIADPRQQEIFPAALSAADISEYRLRYSALAEQLRQSGSAESEREYRALFDLLEQLEREISPGGQASLRRELRGRMGEQAFVQLQSSRDPLFAEYAGFLRRQGFGSGEVDAAYAILNRSQEDLLEVLGSGPTGERAVAALSRVREAELGQLSQLLGDAAARGLLQIRSRTLAGPAATSLPAC